jgi:hypothetical protein
VTLYHYEWSFGTVDELGQCGSVVAASEAEAMELIRARLTPQNRALLGVDGWEIFISDVPGQNKN